MREPPAYDAELGFETVLTEPFVAVLPASHPLAAQRAVQVNQLADCPFVLLPRSVGPPLYDQIAGLCIAAGFTPQVTQHAVEWQTVCALVGAGLGVSGPGEHPPDPPQGRRLPQDRARHRAHTSRRRVAQERPKPPVPRHLGRTQPRSAGQALTGNTSAHRLRAISEESTANQNRSAGS